MRSFRLLALISSILIAGLVGAQTVEETQFRVKKPGNDSTASARAMQYEMLHTGIWDTVPRKPGYWQEEFSSQLVEVNSGRYLPDSISLDQIRYSTLEQLLKLPSFGKVVSFNTRIQYGGDTFTKKMTGADWAGFQSSLKKGVLLSFDEVVVQKGPKKTTLNPENRFFIK